MTWIIVEAIIATEIIISFFMLVLLLNIYYYNY